MFGLRRTPPKIATQDPVRPRFQASPSSNPFDSDTEPVNKATQKPARRTTSEYALKAPNSKGNPFDDDEEDDWGRGASSSSSHSSSAAKHRFGNHGGLENQSVQELENYALNKAEETTKGVRNCLKIGEDIREEATKTLEMLHQQGEQITKTHNMIVDTEKDLTKGEKLLSSLGGMFSKAWKPKKTRNIQGPVIITPGNLSKKGEENMDKRERLGLAALPQRKSSSKTLPADAAIAYQKVDVEKAKQDEALSDLSNVLVDLKSMAVDMGTEIDRQNKAMDHLNLDVDEMNWRVKGANQRARKLIG
ncbi:putative SNAP25 homologous protein SNAP30 [Neltuma alba]|uniref:putative SNAP25 homologous protein SNAP30 n=1 Tax=Neltuma alba TaxID=207710 RepID=UPI0010A2BDBB|nr:putative SNAP25 homologous protein SNAP30 [Prosopis alba]XP_028762047.1 putative SNAP25 homologous protein SNAP30 [Prosopis alba]XP_028762048.1 putative SNAP25 homologous protein SNAP30 [Prosopis alba]XP_028762049.1 putative SNAP25 homologous protein SNAP30 [Prosopis alba]